MEKKRPVATQSRVVLLYSIVGNAASRLRFSVFGVACRKGVPVACKSLASSMLSSMET